MSKTAAWLDLSSTGGTIPVGGNAEVIVSINSVANNMGNGYYEDPVQFVNLTNHDGDCERMCSVEIGVPMPVYVYDMSTDPGWSMEGEWEFGQPTGQGGTQHGNPDPTGGATGANVYGINLNGDYSIDIGGPYFLTTNVIDCSQLTQVSVHFQRWLNTDYPNYVFAKLEASNNGSTWTPLWQNPASQFITDSSWSEYVYDLSAIADNEPTVFLRWSHQVGQSGAYAFSGWNIDDVEIWGIVPSGPNCPPDINGDGVVDVLDLLDVLAAWGATSGPEDINGDGIVDVLDLLELLAAWGPCP